MSSRKEMKSIRYKPIGMIRSPFNDPAGMPIQPTGARRTRGTVEVAAEYQAGLKGLNGFSHVILLYHFHRSRGFNLEVTPFLDARRHGVFATRAPKRPNPIGLSVVRLVEIKGCTLGIEGVDVLDRTPLLDIKPYVPEFDHPRSVCVGWLQTAKGRARVQKADRRFK